MLSSTSLSSIAIALSAIPYVAGSAIVRRDSTTCETIEATTSIKVTHPIDIAYTSENNEYWSADCTNLKPECIIFPTTVDEVSAIVKILNQNNETFSVKSGGHNPNQYFASIDGGPLIATKELNEVIYDAASNTIRVGPGNRWEDIHKALDGTGVTPVGGRIGNVGVGGYMLGGGLSFLSSQYGWAANSIVEAEVVLADGSVVTASATENTDLWMALRGGGANFGIVTAYTLEAHPIGDVYGGNLIYTADKVDEVLSAIYNFTVNYPDLKAGIIPTAELTAGTLIDIFILFIFYDGPTPPLGVFDEFLNIGPGINNLKTRSFADLLTYNNWAVLHGSVYSIATETTTLPSNTTLTADGRLVGPLYLRQQYDHWKNTALSIIAGIPSLVASVAFQPFPTQIAAAAKARGGDIYDFDDDVHRIIFEYDYSYLLPSHRDTVDEANQKLYNGARDLVQQGIANGTLPDAYLPLFMNDGYYRQDFWGRLKPERRELAQKAQAQYDPTGFWTSRTAGGFKL